MAMASSPAVFCGSDEGRCLSDLRHEYLAALGIERNGDAWESYVSDPGKVAEEELQTFVFYPVRVD